MIAGKIATAHENQINFNGWVGEGYILLDPETGAGAYKIAGGGNGGLLSKINELVAKGLFWAGFADYKFAAFATGGAVGNVAGVITSVLDAVKACGNSAGAFLAIVLAAMVSIFFAVLSAFIFSGIGFIAGIVIGQVVGYFESLVVDYMAKAICTL